MQRKILGLLFADSAYGIYKYTRMKPEQKGDLKKRGKEYLNKNMGGLENMFCKTTETAKVKQSNE